MTPAACTQAMQPRLFSPLNINQAPVRAAFDVGAFGCVTLTVARVDARSGALRDTLYHNALPVAAPGVGSSARSAENDVVAKMRLLVAAARSMRPVEWAGCLSSGWAASPGAGGLAKRLEAEFKAVCFVKDPAADDSVDVFLQHAAAAQHLAPGRLLVLTEAGGAEGNGLELLGLETPEGATAEEAREEGVVLRAPLPLAAPEAHRMLCVDVQRRDSSAYSPASSPNPVLPSEFRALAAAAEGTVQRALPPWASARADSGALLVGTSRNGGLLNVMARAAGQATLTAERVEQVAEHHLCRLGDTLIGENYPYPALLLPQLALGVAVCRALRTNRLRYLPDVAATHALLVTPQLWTHSRAHELAQRLEEDPAAAEQQFFRRPHRRFDPNAPDGPLRSPRT